MTLIILNSISRLPLTEQFTHQKCQNPMDSNGTSAIVTTEEVEFDMFAREWRRIWSADNDKKSLAEVQKLLEETRWTPSFQDSKVIVTLHEPKHGD